MGRRTRTDVSHMLWRVVGGASGRRITVTVVVPSRGGLGKHFEAETLQITRQEAIAIGRVSW